MPIPSSVVGLDLTPSVRVLSLREALAYAAGLGAAEPEFLDDAQPSGLRALPFQCVSLEWPVVLSLRHLLEPVLSAEEARRSVHAWQDSTFHRPILPGDTLVTTGRLMAVEKRRAGTLTTLRLETREVDSGALVTETWTGSIYRGVDLDGPDRSLAEAPTVPPRELCEPLTITPISVPREAAHVYSECADIWNPIHTERTVALAAGLPDIILHGTATWARAGLEILRRYSGRDGARLRRFQGRFTNVVIPGQEVRLAHRPAEGSAVAFEVVTAAGAVALSRGLAVMS